MFNDGDRVGGVLYQQFTHGEMRPVAEFNSHNTSIKFYEQFVWQGEILTAKIVLYVR